MRDSLTGYTIPDSHIEIIEEYIQTLIGRDNIFKILSLSLDSIGLNTTVEYYYIEYSSPSTSRMCSCRLDMVYIKSGIRNKRINKILNESDI